MGKLKALDNNLNLAEKRIILRVDLNVPMLEGKVTDKSRIKKIIPICHNQWNMEFFPEEKDLDQLL